MPTVLNSEVCDEGMVAEGNGRVYSIYIIDPVKIFKNKEEI